MEEDAEFVKYWPTLGKATESGVEVVLTMVAKLNSSPKYSRATSQTQLTSSPPWTKFSLQENFLISVGPRKAGILRDLIVQQKPKALIELGGYLGYSSVLSADAMLKAHGDGKGLKLYSLELDPVCAAIARQITQLAGLENIIEVIEGDKITNVDFLFLDHVEGLYEEDFKVVEALGGLKMGAVVVADNVVRPGVPKYREFIRRKKEDGWESSGAKALIWLENPEDELEVSKFAENKN